MSLLLKSDLLFSETRPWYQPANQLTPSLISFPFPTNHSFSILYTQSITFIEVVLYSTRPAHQPSYNLDRNHLSAAKEYLKMAAATGNAPQMELDPKYDHYDHPYVSPEVRNGHPGHTTKEEEAKVFQLRTMLEQQGYKERLDTLSMVACS